MLRKGGRTCHGHTLALATREGFHGLGHGANADLEVVHARDGFFQHAFFVERTEHATQHPGAAQLATQKQVLGNRHGGSHSEVLVDGFDTMAACVNR